MNDHSEPSLLGNKRDKFKVSMDKNGIPMVVLQNSRGASAHISLYGGQVLSWKNSQGEELLFTSNKAIFKPPVAVRGGIPICFPQFGTRGLLEKHGFARNRLWVIDEEATPLHLDQASITLVLKQANDDLKIWPHKFEFRLRISLSEEDNLKFVARVKNLNGKPFSFSIAFRTYFSISDISEVRVEGLETLDYLDNLRERERFTEQGDALTIESEVDRVYLGSSDAVSLFDHGKRRTYSIAKQGLPDTAVWNPWEKKAKAMGDMGDDEYKHMLCLDGAAVEKPITVKAGEEWTGQLEISVVSSC